MTNKRYALVTGGSRGIGSAISRALARELNYPVLINYRSDSAAAEATAAAILAAGGEAETLQFDVSDRADTETKLEVWKAAHPDSVIEVVVNNAGVTHDGLLLWMAGEEWDRVIQTSLNGFYNVTKPLLQDLVRHRYGRIINVASISGVKGTAGQVNYSAAKAGDIGFTRALAQEGARFGITVNTVCPGYIATEMVMAVPENVREQIKSLIPVGRFGEASEIARCVAFLAADEAGFITGATLSANGGQYFA